MTQDSDWGVPEHVDDESDLDFAFRYAHKLRESSYPWGEDAETALHVSVAEIERLRADNKWLLEQSKQAEATRAEQAKQLRALTAENAVLEAKLSSFDNIEKMSIVSIKLAELEWFRRREEWFRRMVDAEGWAEMDAKRCSVWDFERKNPKPGAGT